VVVLEPEPSNGGLIGASFEEIASEGLATLEVRWMRAGAPDAPVAAWFERFPASTEAREDTYLVGSQREAPSVKIRGGLRFEVKVHDGSPGVLSVPGRARGRLAFWRKWSLPIGTRMPIAVDAAGWRRVRKVRRMTWISPDGTRLLARTPGPSGDLGCALELTTVDLDGDSWWTLGLEAAGPARGLRRAVETAAERVFDEAMPSGLELRYEESMSYAEWLQRRQEERLD
jgi:hypothetical protein